jgi:aquaporin Z
VRRALPEHLPEYAIDGALLGLFMLSACTVGVALEHPASPLRVALPEALARRAPAGLAMGLTAVALIYSPWGRRSGAHMNPAVTLAFLALGKVTARDAAGYVAAQLLGGLAGVLLASALLGEALAAPAVAFVATVPGPAGAGVAFAAELVISGLLLYAVLRTAAHPRRERCAGLVAGALVATWITFEAPLSGMSMNPARTLGSALPAGMWTGVWVYLTAPVLAMQVAARLAARDGARLCAKLRHDAALPCIHCGQAGTPRRRTATRRRAFTAPA